jgi:DNA-binding MarR family transcriptional regulator
VAVEAQPAPGAPASRVAAEQREDRAVNHAQGPSRHTTLIHTDEPVTVRVGMEGRWFRLFNWVIESGLFAQMKPAEQAVFVAMGYFASQGNGRFACPSLSSIGNATGYQRSTVIETLQSLCRLGVLERRGDGGGRMTSTYMIVDKGHPTGTRPATPTGPDGRGLTRPEARLTRPEARLTRPVEDVRPVQWAGPNLEEENQSSSSSSGRSPSGAPPEEPEEAAAWNALVANGFSEDDATRLCFHRRRVFDAIDSADGLEDDKKARWKKGQGSRRSYIARYLAEGWSLYEGVERRRKQEAFRLLVEIGKTAFGWNDMAAQAASRDALSRGFVRSEDLRELTPDQIARVWRERAEGVQA